MEGNKDEAMRCCHLAEKLIRSGHNEKALKFLSKSLKLFPTEKAEGMCAFKQNFPHPKSHRFHCCKFNVSVNYVIIDLLTPTF